MYIRALDKDFPLAYTVEAQTELAEKAGGIEKFGEFFSENNAAEAVENSVWMAAVMMKAAAHREKLKSRMLGEEYTGGEPPAYEELRVLLNVGELGDSFKLELSEAMKMGQKTTIEAKEDKRKNGETAQ